MTKLLKHRKYLKYLLLGLAAALAAIFLPHKDKKEISHPRDYSEIRQSGILRAVTEYNALSLFVDGDTLAGFHYDLINAFAKAKGLKAEITPEMSFDNRLKGLEEGRYDLMANSMPVISEYKDSILYTHPLFLNKEVLVQLKREEGDSLFIKSQLDLAHKTLHVVKGSPSISRIQHLSNEIGDTIYIDEIERYGPEQLITLVANGDLRYVVCDERTARAYADSLPELDINTKIGFTQFYAWGVNKKSPVLLDSLNKWLDEFSKSEEYKKIYRKYHKF